MTVRFLKSFDEREELNELLDEELAET